MSKMIEILIELEKFCINDLGGNNLFSVIVTVITTAFVSAVLVFPFVVLRLSLDVQKMCKGIDDVRESLCDILLHLQSITNDTNDLRNVVVREQTKRNRNGGDAHAPTPPIVTTMYSPIVRRQIEIGGEVKPDA